MHEQGEIVDSIETSVERTEVFVSEGTTQLRQAATYKNQIRKKKCILLIILVSVLLILFGTLFWQSS